MQAETASEAAIHAHDEGSGSEAVVFVHGFGAHHRIWSGLADRLTQGTRTVAYDLPGHGLSLQAPGAGSAKFAARAILSDLAGRGVEKAHIVGHSMGGATAVLMALAEPVRVASLTLLAPGGFGSEINGPLLRRYAAATERDELLTCLAAMSGKGAVVPDSVVDSCLAMRKTPGQTEKLVEIAAAITRDDRQGVIPRDLLATMAMPATILWGTRDPVLPFEQTGDLPARFALRAIEGAGHMLVEEAPAPVLEAILVHLAQAD